LPSSLEERLSVEENVSLQWSDDFNILSALKEQQISTLASPPASVPTPDPPSERPLVHDDTLYNDPVVLNQRSRQGRQFKPRRIYDPPDIANFVDAVLDTDIPIEHVTASVLHSNGAEFDVQTMDGADPAAFLPEPQSLKKIAQLPPLVRDAWLRAYRVELQNMLSNITLHTLHDVEVNDACRFELSSRQSCDLMVKLTN
jgi:hypothetical protein